MLINTNFQMAKFIFAHFFSKNSEIPLKCFERAISSKRSDVFEFLFAKENHSLNLNPESSPIFSFKFVGNNY